MKFARLVFTTVMIALLAGAAFAGTVDIETPGQTYDWQPEDWSDPCTLTLDMNWFIGAGPDNGADVGGLHDGDPIVNQTVTNYSTLVWNDWHVQLINGIIQPGSISVYEYGTTDPWDITQQADPGYDDGFTAIAFPPAGWISQNDKLVVSFVFDPIDPEQRVTLKQWPTTDMIPEPGSLVTLSMGLVGFGFAFRRRIK